MVTGHLQEKSGRYYIVLNLKGANNRWKPKWIATGLPTKGNKKRAEAMLHETIKEYEARAASEEKNPAEILFSDYMLGWLELIRGSVEETTFATYNRIVRNQIVPYYAKLGITLSNLQPKHIQSYYTHLTSSGKVHAATIRRHHANIRKALQQAVKTDMILSNPADKVVKPKVPPYVAGFYNDAELNLLLEKVKGTSLELPIIITAFYGLRRGEVLGLKWSAIDFKNKTLIISHTVTEINDEEGKTVIIQKDRTKNKSSFRTLPLVPQVEEALLRKKRQDEEYRGVCKKSYSRKFTDYVFVNEIGELIKPHYLTSGFPHFLEKCGMRRIRFHDLRHSCASLLLKAGANMKEIQEWLGHSNYSTTANIYAHLDSISKQNAANAISSTLLVHE